MHVLIDQRTQLEKLMLFFTHIMSLVSVTQGHG